ncbi:hypothetical protein [Cryptosporangium minutisporangium]|uniref:Uncharacterized protein n=1 Tax=Cryptosporangium minutisporangium TaxID=113569 RepID=A0ABP6T1W9_9ACTN
MLLRSDGWTVEIYQRQVAPDSLPEQRVRVKNLGFVAYDGTDLTRARLMLEDAGIDWADLEYVEDGGAAAAG